jgi:hypothetical protein
VVLKSLRLAWQLLQGGGSGCVLRGTVWIGGLPAAGGGPGELVPGCDEQVEGVVLEVRRG